MQLDSWPHKAPRRQAASPIPRGPRRHTTQSTMPMTTRAMRISAAIAAGILTSVLFSTVVSIAEPQRSALSAKKAAQPQAVGASAALRMADAH